MSRVEQREIDVAECIDAVSRDLLYVASRGVFLWKSRKSPTCLKGQVAGTAHPSGYTRIALNLKSGRRYVYGHRLVWAVENGRWPKDQLDHVDGDRGNNLISNLREASSADNAQNRAKRADCSSSYIGVSWSKRWGCWKANIQVGKAKIYLGSFKNEGEAFAAYAAAKRVYHQFNPVLRKTE